MQVGTTLIDVGMIAELEQSERFLYYSHMNIRSQKSGRLTAPQRFPGYILALTGPSGVGKSTIRRMLAHTCSTYIEDIAIITTRKPKQGDNGEYIYVTQRE